MWDTILATVRGEFSDLNDVALLTQTVIRLLLATALGACLGYEREMRNSTAGLRTHMLVALGVALIVVAAQGSGMDSESMSRVVQGVFAGIGFLGAGAIIKQSEHVRGLTTAASIWATAAIAAAAGFGREATAILATVLALVILSLLLRLERRLIRDQDASGPTLIRGGANDRNADGQ